MDHPLVLPMLIQMAMTALLLYWLAYGRISTIKKAGGIPGLRAAGGFPDKIINRGDNFKNQFELPVIFYALCLLFIVTNSATTGLVIAAWVFIASRILHVLVHVTNNKIFPNRFFAFLIGGLALTFMIVVALTMAI